MSTTVYYDKPAGVTRVYQFDYGALSEVQADETLSSPAVSATPSGLTLGTPTVSGQMVLVSVAGGTAGVEYEITTTVNTSGGAVALPCVGGITVT